MGRINLKKSGKLFPNFKLRQNISYKIIFPRDLIGSGENQSESFKKRFRPQFFFFFFFLEAGPALSVKKIYNNQNSISDKKLSNKIRIVYCLYHIWKECTLYRKLPSSNTAPFFFFNWDSLDYMMFSKLQKMCCFAQLGTICTN